MARYSGRENLVLNDTIKFDNKGGAILGVLEGPVADFIHPTRNGRTYNEELWEKVLNNDIVKEQFASGGILGELDHPKDRDDICTEKVAVIMPEPPVKKDGEYWGRFNILDTPCGRIVYTLAKAGFKLGVSSRGNGDYDEYTGKVDPDTYDFTCFDIVVLPAVKDARMNLVTEGLTKDRTFRKLITEQLNRSSDTDKRIMNETLEHLKEDLDRPHDQGEPEKVDPESSDKDTEGSDERSVPDIKVDDTVLTVSVPEEPVTDKDVEPCEECEGFDDRLGDLLTRFLDEQGFEMEDDGEKEHFVRLFHDMFPEIGCDYCAERHDDKEVGDNDAKSLAADDTGAEDEDVALLEQLQKTLKENKVLKDQVRDLQAQKAVGNSKVSRLQEEVERFKTIAAQAGKKALTMEHLESDNRKLGDTIKALNEDLSKANDTISKGNTEKDRIREGYDKLNAENEDLRSELLKLRNSSSKLDEKYQRSRKLIERYRNAAYDIANRYIDSKALALGVTSNEIKNRLGESYTLDDVDRVCDQLQRQVVNISKLPFQLDKPGSMRARLRENRGSDPLKDMDSEYDDSVDNDLLELAGLFKR